MKTFTVKEKPNTLLGRPFRIMDIEADVKVGEEQPIINHATMQQLLTLLVFSIPKDKLTTKDTIEAGRFIHQLRAGKDGSFTLEDEELSWIKKMVDTYGPSTYGVNSVVLAEFLDSKPT